MSQMYQGVPREQIPWFPMINPELCDQCMKCLEFCPYDVYEEVDGKLEVARPLNCPVGCSRCRLVCPQKAIHFMDMRDLNMLLMQLRQQRAGM